MDYSEIKKFHFTGRVTYPRLLPIVSAPEYEPQPKPQDNIEHSAAPRKLTEADCNGLSNADVADLAAMKYMDPLHKADKIAESASRSSRLKKDLKSDGASRFVERYKKK